MENAGNPRVYKDIPNSKNPGVYKDTVIQKDGGSYNMAKIDAKTKKWHRMHKKALSNGQYKGTQKVYIVGQVLIVF